MSSHLFTSSSDPYAPSSSTGAGAGAGAGYYGAQPDLQFYSSAASAADLQGSMGAGGGAGAAGGGGAGFMSAEGPWWHAFGTGGLEGEEPLLQELGINPSHIIGKSLAVLNPFSKHVDERIMDDADLAGPLVFWGGFGLSLLLSGKAQFGYIYGVALFGSLSIYTLLNLMSPQGIDASRVASVLGYCLLPMVLLSILTVPFGMDHLFGYLLSLLSTAWCTYAASGIFVAVLRMSEQRLLVAYPVGLLYACFALLSVFSVGGAGGAAGGGTARL